LANHTDSFQKAKEYAFLLLKFRLRSEKEIAERLKKKKFTPEAIDQTVYFLKSKGFIDDGLFAKAWIDSRLKKPFGLNRVIRELRIKGIAEETIQGQVSGLKEDYSEKEVVFGLAKERSKRLKGVEPQKARQRLYGYLLRRGFSVDTVIDAISKLDKK
jgi:regulatory protein